MAEQVAFAPAEVMTDSQQIYVNERINIDSDILNKDEIDKVFARTLTGIAVNKENGVDKIPELLMGNGDMVIFKRGENNEGWFLMQGESLVLQFSLDLDINPGSDKNGESIRIGYIKDGKIVSYVTEKKKNFEYCIEAEQEGIYYPYLVNVSAGNIILDRDGSIRILRDTSG